MVVKFHHVIVSLYNIIYIYNKNINASCACRSKFSHKRGEKQTLNECINVPLCVFPKNNEKRSLYPDELFLYCLLYRWRVVYDHMAVINIDGISDLSPYKFMAIKPNGDASRNKAKIKKMVNHLHVLKYVQMEGGLDLGKVKNNDLLYIKFNDEKESVHYIPYDIFDCFTNPLEFYIYAYIDTYSDHEGCTISYKKWSYITGYSHDKIEEVIKKMNDESYHPRIWKFSGEYYREEKEIKQLENIYFTNPDEETKKLWRKYYGQYSGQYYGQNKNKNIKNRTILF